MARTESISEFPPDVRVMLDESIRHALTGEGDPAILARIHEEAEKIKQQVFEKHGLLDIGTPAIRELRDE